MYAVCERETEREIKRERESERTYVCVCRVYMLCKVCGCVCVRVCVCVIMYRRRGDWITQLPLQLLFRDVEYLQSFLLEVLLLFLQSDKYNTQT